MPSPARTLALELLLRLEDPEGPTLDVLLALPAPEALDPRERAFLMELVLGCLRRRGQLDHALAPLLDRPAERVTPEVRAILRLGAHQILNLRVPARAAVSESVELARGAGVASATGFVNAVLRRLDREGPRAYPDPAREPLAWLTTAGSLPTWLATRWLAELGAERARARAEALLETPGIDFRANLSGLERLREAGLEWNEHPSVPGALRLVTGRLQEAQSRGWAYAQDPGSQLVGWLAAEQRGSTLDACAAPGGKTLILAEQPGCLVAAELAPRRLRRLAKTLARFDARAVRLVRADAAQLPFGASFQTVLLDAPCSGLGTLGRHPDIRWRATPVRLLEHAERQQRLLAGAARAVAPRGRMVYAVCSLEPEETTSAVGRFLEAQPDFSLDTSAPAFRRWQSPSGYSIRPETDRSDGFFAAVLVRG